MLATIEMIREKYGGAEGYLEEKCGFGFEEVDKIRAKIREEAGLPSPRAE